MLSSLQSILRGKMYHVCETVRIQVYYNRTYVSNVLTQTQTPTDSDRLTALRRQITITITVYCRRTNKSLIVRREP